MSISDNGLDYETHLAGLRAELANAKRAGRDTEAIEDELARVSGVSREFTSKGAAPEQSVKG